MASRFTTADRQLVQENRMAKLFTPLSKTENGEDRLVFERLDVTEGLSELFEIRVDALSTQPNVDFKDALGLNCCVSVETYDGVIRYFNGVLTEAQWLGGKGEFYAYRLTLRPWMWLLSREADCRIFKGKTIIEIAKLIFGDAGFGDDVLNVNVSQEMQPFEYCVQYRESDLAFVSRLLEEYGLYTYFTHELDKHILHIVDSVGGHDPVRVAHRVPGVDKPTFGPIISYRPLTGSDRRKEQHIYTWLSERRVRTGKVELRDYDYNKSTTKLVGDRQGTETYAKSDREAYDYPGRFTETGPGQHLAKVRLEAEQALDHRRHAAGDAMSLFPGVLFTLDGHQSDDAEYLVVRATHAYVSEAYRSGSGGGDSGEIYHGHYELQESSRQFRAPLITPKARIYGPQTAFVVTKSAGSPEEIDVDDQGRIWVNFHWNRFKPNEDCSRPVRVAQMWAGKGWGWQVIPRVGMEVVVEFLEGDPDQPLVTGCVYNSTYNYPYALPGKKNISGVKSDSTKGHNGFNEYYFDDTKGSELIKMKAEKDRLTIVQDTETREVWNWQSEEIGKNFKQGPDHDSRFTKIHHGSDKLVIDDGDWVQVVNRHWRTQVDTGDVEMKIKAGNQTEEISTGNYSGTLSMGNYSQTLSMGNWSTKLDLGAATFEAMQSITLKVGGSSIVVDQMGVHIKGMMVDVEGQIQLSLKGLMTSVNGTAMTTVQGGIVMIN